MKAMSCISSVPRSSRKRDTLRNKDLARVQSLQGDAITFIASTDKGIITFRESSKNCIGGIPLLKVF
jgi:ribosomal protein S8